MSDPTLEDNHSEVTFVSFCQYFAQMWILGTKIIFKAVVGWIMICLMLGLPAFLFQFIPDFFVANDMTRQGITLIAFALYFLVITPIAFYVGGSTVGFCPWNSASDFAKKQNKH